MASRLPILFLALCAGSAAAGEPLFEYQGRPFTVHDLSPRMQRSHEQLLAEQHQQMRTLVDEMLFDLHVRQLAGQQGRAAREVGAELLAVPEPAEQAVRAFHDANRARIPQPYEQVEERIRQHLVAQAAAAKREAIIARLKDEGGFRLLLAEPPAPRVDIDTRGQPVRGDPEAAITLVEFADYQCPACRNAVKLLELVLEKYPRQVKLVYMDFPINPSGISRRVAHGGVCAQAQGRFWEYHDLAFERQPALDHDSPRALADALGLDGAAFDACLRDPATAARVSASEAQALRLGLRGTPALFVDGRPFPSFDLLRDLAEYIEARKAGPS